MGAKIGRLVAVMAVVGANYSMNSRVSVHDSSTAISNAQYQVLARNAALTGFERMKQHLSTSFSSTNLTGTVDGIAYSTTVKVAGDVARITSIGNYRGPRSGDQETYIIKSEFTRTAGTASKAELPAYMNYALLAEDDLRLSGNAGAAYIYSSGAGSSELNANFHTNGDLTVNGKGNAAPGNNSIDGDLMHACKGLVHMSALLLATTGIPSFSQTTIRMASHIHIEPGV